MICLVVGMHRSGTSALAGMLHSNGIIMGRDDKWHPKPMRENPKGFFENRDFRALNDQILRDNGYKVKSFSPEIPTINSTHVRAETMAQMELLVREYHTTYENWGFKDPRTCLTLGVWFEVMTGLGIYKDIVRVLIPCRPTDDVVASMMARGNKEQRPGQFRDLAMAYNERIAEVVTGIVDYKTVGVKRLIHEPEAVAMELSAFTGCSITDTSFIEPTIADRAKAGR
jgi:hypothetical protein